MQQLKVDADPAAHCAAPRGAFTPGEGGGGCRPRPSPRRGPTPGRGGRSPHTADVRRRQDRGTRRGSRACRRHDLRCPRHVVGSCRLDSVTSVDEQERERRLPVRGDDGREPDDTDHRAFEVRFADRAEERRERVQPPGRRIDQRRVVVLPPCLVLLGPAVVVDREQHRRGIDVEARRAEVHRRLAAVGADLEQRHAAERTGRRDRGVVQREALVDGHEALRRFGDRPQPGVHVSVRPAGLGS